MQGSLQASAAPKMVLVLSLLPICKFPVSLITTLSLLPFQAVHRFFKRENQGQVGCQKIYLFALTQYKKASPNRESADGVAFGSPFKSQSLGTQGTICSSMGGMELKEMYDLAEKFRTKIKSFIGPRKAFLHLTRITSKTSFSQKVAPATLLALPAFLAVFAF